MEWEEVGIGKGGEGSRWMTERGFPGTGGGRGLRHLAAHETSQTPLPTTTTTTL